MHQSTSSGRVRILSAWAVAFLAAGCSQKAPTVNVTDRCAGVVCAASDACHVAGVCDGDSGTCSNPPKGIVPTVDPLSFTAPQGGVVYAGDLVQLDAPAVTLGCGPVAPGDVTYRWAILQAPAGSRAELTSATVAAPAFVPDVAGGSYELSLTVSDRLGNDAPPRLLTIDVSACGANAPALTGIVAPQSGPAVGGGVVLVAQGWDADLVPGGVCGTSPSGEPLQFSWRLVSAPAGSTLAVVPAFGPSSSLPFTLDVAGIFAFEVTARDGTGLLSEPMTISVPTGACGPTIPPITPPAALTVGTPVDLTPPGGISDVCVSGPVLTGRWSLLSRPPGSGAAIASPSSGTFVPDLPGTYVVQYLVTDQAGFSSAATVAVAVGSCTVVPSVSIAAAYVAPPGGDAGGTPPLLGDRVDLSAVVAPAPCGVVTGAPFAYAWTLLARPPGSGAALASSGSGTSSFVADVAGGSYQVAVTVTDAFGNAATAFKTIEVSTCGTQAPIATILNGAGANVSPRDSLVLSGSAAVDNTGCPARLASAPATLSWALVSAPVGATALWSGQTGGSVTFAPQAPSLGTPYRISLTATGTNGAVGPPAFIDVTVDTCGSNPPRPIDFAAVQQIGGTQYVYAPPVTGTGPLFARHPISVTATLVDADSACGRPPQQTIVAWRLLAAPVGSATRLSGADLLTTTFTPDLGGTYSLELTARDETGATSVTRFDVPVTAACGGNAPVVGFISAAPSAPLPGDAVALTATVTDADAAIPCFLPETVTWDWRLTAAPPGSAAVLLGPTMALPSFVPDVAGSYAIAVTVTDSTGLSSTGSVGVTVNPRPALEISPALAAVQWVDFAAGSAAVSAAPYWQGFPIQLAATAGEPSAGLSCGAGLSCSYAWSLVGLPAGSRAAIDGAAAASPSLTPDRAGAYTVRLTVTEGGRSTTLDFAPLMVGPCGGQPPVAAFTFSPGFAAPGSTVQVDAGASSDPDADPVCRLAQPLAYRWELVALPAGSTAVLNAPTAVNPTFTADLAGTYRVRLTVSDGLHATSLDRTFTASVPTALPFGGSFQAATVDSAGLPVMAVYDPTTSGGLVQVWRCTAGCDVPATATWAQVGSDVDTNVGALTWAAGEEPRPVDVAVDSTGQIAVAYKTLTATTAGIGSCSVAVATFTGGAWSHVDAAAGFAPLVGCVPGGGASSDWGRWLSLAIDPSGRIRLAAAAAYGAYDLVAAAVCAAPAPACAPGQPAAGMTFGWSGLTAGVPLAGNVLGRFVQILPLDGTRVRLAYMQSPGIVAYQEWDESFAGLLGQTWVAEGGAGQYVRLGSASGTAALAWQDPAGRQVRMAACNGSTCTASWPVDGGPAADVGADLAMWVTPGATWLAYRDATHDLLQLATAPTPAGPFAVQPVASGPTSLALVATGSGVPWVVYTVGASPALWTP